VAETSLPHLSVATFNKIATYVEIELIDPNPRVSIKIS